MERINRRQHERPRDKRKFKDSTRQQLIDHIYSTVDLSKFNFKLLEFESELPKLFDKKYTVTPNFRGFNCLLVFTKIRDRFYAFTVDRKTLKFARNRVDPEKVNIKYVCVEVDSSIYNGTILDGTFIDRRGRGVNEFIISDIYTFKGADYSNVNLRIKMSEIKSYFSTSSPELTILKNRHKKFPELQLIGSKFYDIHQIKTVIDKVIPSIRGFESRGVTFYPERSGTKMIYLFGNEKRDMVNREQGRDSNRDKKRNGREDRKSHQRSGSNSKSEKLKKFKYCTTTSDPVYAILEMQKTNAPEIYTLNAIKKKTIKGKSVLVRHKMGVAHIPTMKKSKWCREIMMKNPKGKVLVKCLFNNEKSKWEPMEVEKEKKKPDKFKDIPLEIVEETDSEDE